MPAHQANRCGSNGFTRKTKSFPFLRRNGVLQSRRTFTQFTTKLKQVITQMLILAD